MTATMTMTDSEIGQIAATEAYYEKVGLTVHEAETEYGKVRFTIESRNGGHIWSPDVLTVNRIPHMLFGGYEISHMFDSTSGTYAPNPMKPIFWITGYPGLSRKDGSRWSGRIQTTENAADKISRALGAALAPFLADTTEGIENARIVAAQEKEDEADYEERRAERILENVMNLRAEAFRIRSGEL